MRIKINPGRDENLPTLEEIKRGLDEIDSSSFDGMPYEDVRKIFMEALGLVPKMIVPNGHLPKILYRVTRGYQSFQKDKVSSYAYPPINVCKRGRANIEGHPVFYASLQKDTAIREVNNSSKDKLKKGDEFFISSWNIDIDSCHYSQFIYDDSVKLGKMFADINTNNIDKFSNKIAANLNEKRSAFIFLNKKLGAYFIQKDNHSISSFLSHFILYEDRANFPFTIEAIMYPSVQEGLDNFNFAFHPEFYHKHIKLKHVTKVLFNKLDKSGKSNFDILEVGFPVDEENIKWYERDINFDNVKYSIVKVNIQLPDDLKLEPSNKIDINTIQFKLVTGELIKAKSFIKKYIFNDLNSLKEILLDTNGIISKKGIYQKVVEIGYAPNKSWQVIMNDHECLIESFVFNFKYKVTFIDPNYYKDNIDNSCK